jgi:hypothetical protein
MRAVLYRQGICVYFFESTMGAFLRAGAQKPGFPLQFPGSADALPAGFPLQSLARKKSLV